MASMEACNSGGGNGAASYVAAKNLQYGRKRFKLSCPRPPPVQVESADIDEDEDMVGDAAGKDSFHSADSDFLIWLANSDAETNKGEDLVGATAADKHDSTRGDEEQLVGAPEDDERRVHEEPAVNVLVENKGSTYDKSRLRKRTRVNISYTPVEEEEEELNSLFDEEDDDDDDDDDDTSCKSQKNTRRTRRKTDGEGKKNTRRTRARNTDGESKKNTGTSCPRNTDGESKKDPMTSSRNTDDESKKDPMTSGKRTDNSAKFNAENVVRILGNSLLDTDDGHIKELLNNISKELVPPIVDKSKYKFRFPTDIPKPPVEKSEDEVELDNLSDSLNMSRDDTSCKREKNTSRTRARNTNGVKKKNTGTSCPRNTDGEKQQLVAAATEDDEELVGAPEDDERRGYEEPAVKVENKSRRLRKRTRVNISITPVEEEEEEYNSLFDEEDGDDTSCKSQKNISRTRARNTNGERKKNTRSSSRITDSESQKNQRTSSRNTEDDESLPMTSGKKTDIIAKLNANNVVQILGNSLLDTEDGHTAELLINISKEAPPIVDKSKYKFRFPTEIPKPPVEKSEHDKLFDLLNMYITSERIGSTAALEDNNGAETGNNGAPITTETDRDTLCSQGKHDILYKDPIGLVCQNCSHVELESRYMLPEFYTPRSRRPLKTDSQQAKTAEYPSYLLDENHGTGSKKHGIEDYKHLETMWDLIPDTRRSLYEHQREGFEFIWKNLVGDTIVERLEKPLSSSGHGCIITHAPGTGKTRLTIVFLQSFMKMYPDSRPVIVAPKSLLLTWEEEFKKWNLKVPFHNLNKAELTGHENTAAASLWKKGNGSSKNNETDIRVLKLFSWKMNSSILGITYQLFEHIVGAETRDPTCNPTVQQLGKALLKLPTVLVLDEGHTPRNNDSNIYRFLHNVETKRRIILSGTPFQNNFDELYNTLCLVNPEFEKTTPKDSNVAKTKNKKTGRALQSKWSSLTNFGGHDGEKLRELKALIAPFVHVHKGTILQENCPGLTDSMVLLRPTELQQELIALLKEKAGTNHFHYSRVMSIISVHPSLLPKEWLDHQDFSAYRDKIERLKTDPFGGTKTKFVIELCRMSQALDEKVVIFCQYLDPLDIIRDQLQSYFRWYHGREVLYIKGTMDPKQRQSCINEVNDPKSNVRVLLASIKACSEGIHLVGVSRVVLLDVVWNPSVERQAISRAYRIGQQKMVYTYHLIDKITEMDKYTKQLEKDRLSELVFSSKDESHNSKKQMPDVVSEDSFLQQMFQRNDKLGNMIERICYNPKASNLADSFNSVAE